MALIDEVEPLAEAHELIEDLKGNGHTVVLASSAKPDEVEHTSTCSMRAGSPTTGRTPATSSARSPTRISWRPRARRRARATR